MKFARIPERRWSGWFPLAGLCALAACGRGTGPAAAAMALCDVTTQSAGSLVQVRASIVVRADGTVAVTDARCAAVRIPLQVTGAAAKIDLAGQLKSAATGSSPAGASLNATLRGVYTPPPAGPVFTAEDITDISSGK